MRSEKRDIDPDVRDAIDTLADRVDMLAAIVRETAGSLSASKGEVASLDRRVQERIGEDTQRSAAALASVRSELEALRSFVEESPKRSGTVAVAASDPLKETVATLAERIETLAEVVRSTAGRLAAEQSRISILTEALAKGDERTEERFAEIRRSLQAVSEQAARAAAPSPNDPGLEQRVEKKVGSLADRLDFLSGTVTATAGQLAARDGELAQVEQRTLKAVAQTDEAVRSARAESQQALMQTTEAVRSMRADLEGLKQRLAVDPALSDRVDGLVDSVQALGDRVGTLSGIVGETVGSRTGREPEIAALEERLGEVGSRIDGVARELRREIDALATAAADGTSPVGTSDEIELQVAAFGAQLGRFEAAMVDASGAAEQVGQELRAEINALAASVARERGDIDRAMGRTNEAIRSMRADLEALKESFAVDPQLSQRVDGLVNTVQALGDRVGTLSGIVGETAGRGPAGSPRSPRSTSDWARSA